MKNKKKTQIGFYRIINNKVAYSVVVLATVISLIIINVSLWSLYVQIEKLVTLETGISFDLKSNSLENIDKEKLTVKITLSNKQTRIFDGITEQPQKISLLDALKEISDTKNFTLFYEQKEGRTLLKKFDNIELDKNIALHYYVNGQEIQDDITQIKIGIGDIAEIKTL